MSSLAGNPLGRFDPLEMPPPGGSFSQLPPNSNAVTKPPMTVGDEDEDKDKEKDKKKSVVAKYAPYAILALVLAVFVGFGLVMMKKSKPYNAPPTIQQVPTQTPITGAQRQGYVPTARASMF
jgi:hypothetical protein